MSLNLRAVEVFRPYQDEFPEQLLWDAGAAEDCVDTWRGAQLVRIAKYHGEVAAVYAMEREDLTTFRLRGVVVAQSLRRQGLGRWMTGHAIGVAESKGGRCVLLDSTGASRCFAHIGFLPQAGGWRFDLIQE